MSNNNVENGQNSANDDENISGPPTIIRSNAIPIGAGLSPEKGEKLCTFMAITGADPETSAHYLEALDWQLESALSMFMEGVEEVKNSTFAANNSTSSNFESSISSESSIGGTTRSHFKSSDYIESQEQAMKEVYMPSAIDEDTVRAPAPRVHDTLLGSIASADRRTSGHLTAPLSPVQVEPMDWLFPPPTDILQKSNLIAAKQKCLDSKLWMMVNIQDHSLFDSHRLNRDVWSDDTVRSLLIYDFALWQRDIRSEEALEFCSRHSFNIKILPVIAIIDPRTGGLLVKIEGFISAEDFCSVIIEFTDQYNMEEIPHKAPVMRLICSRALQHFESYDDKSESSEDEYTETIPQQTKNNAEVLMEEPPIGASDITRIQIRLPEGTASIAGELGNLLSRRFLLTDPLSNLYHYVTLKVPEALAGRRFELVSSYPRKVLINADIYTLLDADLKNTSIIMRWL